MIILLVEPTLFAQSTLVSPDIPLLFFVVLLLNEIFHGGKYLKLIAVVGLSLTSMRGWMTAFILFIFEMIIIFWVSKKSLRQIIQSIISYLPGGLIAIIFLLLHYRAKGWIVYHAGSPWAPSFEKVDFAGFIYNIGIYAWRLLDFGRFIVWIFALLFIKKAFVLFRTDLKFRKLIILLSFFLIVFPLNMLTHKYLTQHRYFMPVHFIMSLIVLYLLVNSGKWKYQTIIILVFLAGNFIPYPDTIAKGWDSTIAYLPYNNLRKSAVNYIIENEIPQNTVKSWFPNTASFKKTDLIDSEKSFSSQPLDSCRYCFYSNVFNDITDVEYYKITRNWKLKFSKSCLGVRVEILENPKPYY
jgi:hypothetical protein